MFLKYTSNKFGQIFLNNNKLFLSNKSVRYAFATEGEESDKDFQKQTKI